MRYTLIFLAFLFSTSGFSQNYYPKLNNLLFEEEGVINPAEYNSFITEVKRISEKIFYKNYQMSFNGNSGFHSLQIIPKKDSIDNIFKSPITVIFDKEYNTKTEGIPMTYSQDIDEHNKILNSSLNIDKGGFNLLIPEKLFRSTASKKAGYHLILQELILVPKKE